MHSVLSQMPNSRGLSIETPTTTELYTEYFSLVGPLRIQYVADPYRNKGHVLYPAILHR